MRFAFDDDQLLFRDTVRDVLAKEHDPDVLRRTWDTGERAPDVWATLAELGVLGLTVPEEHGGLGMGALDWVLVFEELGRSAVPDPVVETVAVAAPLIAELDGDVAGEWLPRLAAGELVVTTMVGEQTLVLDADVADLLLVARQGRIVAVPGDRLRTTRQTSVDGARHLFTVDWSADDELARTDGEPAHQLTDAAFDRGALASAAQLLGLSQHLLDVTVGYVSERQQFGVPVGSFQAVKHHLADALLRLEFARPAVYRAAYSTAHDLDTRSRDVSMAKAMASDAASFVAAQALQCHGAIAYTVEYDLHMWMKRVWALATAWGDAPWHRRRVGLSVLGPPPAH